MEKDLYEKGEVSVKLQDGDIVISYEGKGASGTFKIKGEYFLDLLKDAIPGQIDDTIIDIIKAAIKA